MQLEQTKILHKLSLLFHSKIQFVKRNKKLFCLIPSNTGVVLQILNYSNMCLAASPVQGILHNRNHWIYFILSDGEAIRY